MVDKESKEESEYYYSMNPAKPKARVQYDAPIGPEHPHSSARVGRKELGPTRATLEAEERRIKKEKEKKFQRDFEIESRATAARLRAEKQEAKQKPSPAYKPHPSFGGMVVGKVKERLISAWNAPPSKPASRSRKRRPGRPTQVVRRSREIRAPAQPRGEFGFGGMELPGWGSSGRKRKGGFGGLGLL